MGGALALAGSLSLAELGAATPEAGGVYVYLRDAYGKLAAFLYGWAALLVIESGGIATLAVAFSIYSLNLFPSYAPGTKTGGERGDCGADAREYCGCQARVGGADLFTLAKLTGLAIIVGFALFAHHLTPDCACRRDMCPRTPP